MYFVVHTNCSLGPIVVNDSRNNQIYRILKITFKLHDSDLLYLWKSAGFDKSSLWSVKRLYRQPEHKDYMPLSGKKLAKFLNALVISRGLEIEGASVTSLIKTLLDEQGLESTGDSIADAKLLLTKVRPLHKTE